MTAPLLAGKTLGSTSDNFVIAEWRDPGNPTGSPRPIAPRHLHLHDDEAWYVLEGRLVVERGGDQIEAPAGSAVFVPRGTPHTYWNPDPTSVRYLLTMTPQIYRLIEAIHRMSDRSATALHSVFREHDSELLEH